MTVLRRFCLALCLLAALVGCSSAPDEETVSRDVAARLATAFDGDVLGIDALRRLGSAPAPDAADGTPRRIVYYNATLNLARDYAFNDWDALNPQSLATLLGATARGVSGLEPAGNRAGDTLRVHGSITYRKDGDGWRPVAFIQPPPAQAPPMDNTGSASHARSVIERIRNLFDNPPAEEEPARAIITEELDAAYHQIALRLERLERAFLIAGGPIGGEYDRLARAMAAFGNQRGIRSAALETDGSLENLNLLAANRADVAIVQNDVAARFVAEQGDKPGPHAIRALGSLFPEPLHLVVRADSDIHSVADLAGKRFDLGLRDSGSRRTAEAVLKAHGVDVASLTDEARGGPAAAQALRDGEIDGFAAVINAPARFIQELSADLDIRLLPIEGPAPAGEPGLVPITMPQGTYPGQSQPTPTLAVAALLVGRADLDAEDARSLVESVYQHIDFPSLGSGAGGQISARNARVGISIPLHEAAPPMLDGVKPELPGEVRAPAAAPTP